MESTTINYLEHLETNLDFWNDGKIAPLDEPFIHGDEQSVNYANAGIEGGSGIRRKGGNIVIVRPKTRFSRFIEKTAKELFLEVKYTPEQLTEATKELIIINESKINNGQTIRTISDGKLVEFNKQNLPDRWYIRPVVRNCARNLGVYSSYALTGVYIIVEPLGTYLGADALKNGVILEITKQRRAHPDSTNHAAKCSFHYHVGRNARKEAVDAGANEGILRDVDGYIADGSGSSPAMIKDGVLKVPKYHSRLRGITLESIIELARNETDLKIKEADIFTKEFKTADEVLITGNAVTVMFARQVDDQVIGDGTIGPYTKKLRDMFFGIIQNDPKLFPKCGEYQRWCEPVYS